MKQTNVEIDQLSIEEDHATKKKFQWKFIKNVKNNYRFKADFNFKQRFKRQIHLLKIFLTHLFSTTGLCVLVVGYCCLGASMFVYLESKNELKIRYRMDYEKKKCIYDFWNYTITNNVLYPKLWRKMALNRIEQLEKIIINAVQKDGYSLADKDGQWSFSSALLYSVTIITTIGFGNMTCKTDLGRIATILYAIIGIPITFLCLANLGNIMANAFTLGYHHFCCCLTKKSNRIKSSKIVFNNDGRTELMLNNLNDNEKCVPVCLVILVVIGYILLGTFMFAIWEQWTPIEGAYFCFTTLTTIGFGDLVPGSARFSYDKDGQIKFIICSVYMVLGLSLLAMSFNLVQAEMVNKCFLLAKNFGIISTTKNHFNHRKNQINL